jgi:GT2 family glycosyltransferase
MHQSRPDVSLIIVNWNTRQYLLDCIQSLLDQTSRTSLEIVVVDNASHDGSPAALRAAHPEVTLIENGANFGFARANNIGFKVAAGRYLCLVNTDVIALDGVIDKMVAYLDSHPDVGVLGPRTVTRELELRQNCRRFPTLANAAGDYLMLRRLLPGVERFEGRTLKASTYTTTHDAEVLSGCFMMVRREAFDEVGPLDEDFFFYGEDTDWCKRFHDAGWRVVYFADAEAIHFGGGSTKAYPVKYYLTMEQADLKYWRKHQSVAARTAYVAMKTAYHLAGAAAWFGLSLVRRDEHSKLKWRGHGTNLVWLTTRRSLAPRT